MKDFKSWLAVREQGRCMGDPKGELRYRYPNLDKLTWLSLVFAIGFLLFLGVYGSYGHKDVAIAIGVVVAIPMAGLLLVILAGFLGGRK